MVFLCPKISYFTGFFSLFTISNIDFMLSQERFVMAFLHLSKVKRAKNKTTEKNFLSYIDTMSEWCYNIFTRCQNRWKEVPFMPKGSPELTEKRKNEIIDACEEIYKAKGFYGVNIKEISTKVSVTRPAIYNYFETKEEILLGLLAKKYENWCEELESIIPSAKSMSVDELADSIAMTLTEKDILLRILNMNLYEIEQNSRIERLAEFKTLYARAVSALTEILCSYNSDITDSDCTNFCNSFCAFMIGAYPFTHHTEKQNQAMELAGVKFAEPTVYQMVYKCLLRLIPNK